MVCHWVSHSSSLSPIFPICETGRVTPPLVFSQTFLGLRWLKPIQSREGCRLPWAHAGRWWSAEGSHQEGRASAQALRRVPGDHGQDNTQMVAKAHTPGRIVFQSPAAGCLLFLFPSGKEGSIRPWKTDPICRSGNQNTFLKFCNSMGFGKCFAI